MRIHSVYRTSSALWLYRKNSSDSSSGYHESSKSIKKMAENIKINWYRCYHYAPQWMLSHQSRPIKRKMEEKKMWCFLFSLNYKGQTKTNILLFFHLTFTVVVTSHCPRGDIWDRGKSCKTIPRFPVDSHLSTMLPPGSCVTKEHQSSLHWDNTWWNIFWCPLALFFPTEIKLHN